MGDGGCRFVAIVKDNPFSFYLEEHSYNWGECENPSSDAV